MAEKSEDKANAKIKAAEAVVAPVEQTSHDDAESAAAKPDAAAAANPVADAAVDAAADEEAAAPAAAAPASTAEKHAEKDEAISRKRDREGSVEPSSAVTAKTSASKATAPRSSDALPAKKNRIIEAAEEDGAQVKAASASASAPATESEEKEKEKVGQIRRRVEELSYEERESKRADTGARRKSNELPTAAAATTEGADTSTSAAPTETAAPAQASTASADTAPPTASQTAPPPTTAARKQPTFSSFSSSSSPFASSSASSGASGPSWLAAGGSSSSLANGASAVRSGGTSGSTGAIKPSALGSSSTDSQPSSTNDDTDTAASSTSSKVATPSASTPAKSTPPPTATKTSAGLGFGAFAGSRPFTKAPDSPQAAPSGTPPTASSALSSLAATVGKESVFDQDSSGVSTPSSQVAEPGTPAAAAAASAASGEGADEDGNGANKVKVQKKADAELATGEEEERTVHSVRAKLYAIMKGEGENATSAADGQWKERGTGTVRVNVPKQRGSELGGNAAAARLVMRAEGVLRLILNVALFSGMKVELAQDKFVRFVALENGQLVHFALRVSNPAAAHALYSAIRGRIPRTTEAK